MKKILISLITLGLLFSFPLSSFSKELKIGYFDIFSVFNEYEKTKSYDKILEGQKEKEEKKLEEKKQEIEKLQSKISLLKEEEQQKQRNEIDAAVLDYRKLQQEIVTDLKKQRDEKMKEIIDDINLVITDYAKKNGFDLVVHENAVLYGDETMDVTADILKIVNEKYKK